MSYMNMFISTWVLLVAGLVFMIPMMITRIKNTTDLEDEAVYVYLPSNPTFLDV